MKFIKLFLALFFVSICFCTSAQAEVEFTIESYYIDAVVNPDGSVRIKESIDYDYKTPYNGFLRDIDVSDTGGIKGEVSVSVNGIPLSRVSNVSASNRASYQAALDGNLYRIKVLSPGDGGRVNVSYDYMLSDTIRKYGDVAELNRTLVDRGWNCEIKNIRIKITVPEGASTDELRVFGHGPLSGEAEIISDREFLFTVPSIDRGGYVDCRAVFPERLVPQAKLTDSAPKLQDIIAGESRLADETNAQRAGAKAILALLYVLMFLLPAAGVALLVYVYLKHDREYASRYMQKYVREPPSEHLPYEVGYLMHGSVGSGDLFATLLHLVYRKALSMEQTGKKGAFAFARRNDNANLNPVEKKLIEWLIDDFGGGSFSTDELDKIKNSQVKASEFSRNFNSWKTAAELEAESNRFFEDKSLIKYMLLLLGVIYIVIGVWAGIYFAQAWFAITAAVGVIMIIWASRLSKRSKSGNELYARWKSFRNFLKDFSNLERSNLPEIALWEYYLVYAVTLGVAEDVIKQLPKIYSKEELESFGGVYVPAMAYGQSGVYFMRSVAHMPSAFDHSFQNIQSAATSRTSSGAGFGGGFSGGGGSFGGGGGGGGW